MANPKTLLSNLSSKVAYLKLRLSTIYKITATFFFALLLYGCGPGQALIPRDINPLALQTMQVKTLEAPKQQVFNASVSALQDLGYQIRQADVAAGFISAESTGQIQDKRYRNTRVNLFILSSSNGQSKTRMSITETSFSDRYNLRKIPAELDAPDLYQIIYNAIQQNLFSRSGA